MVSILLRKHAHKKSLEGLQKGKMQIFFPLKFYIERNMSLINETTVQLLAMALFCFLQSFLIINCYNSIRKKRKKNPTDNHTVGFSTTETKITDQMIELQRQEREWV